MNKSQQLLLALMVCGLITLCVYKGLYLVLLLGGFFVLPLIIRNAFLVVTWFVFFSYFRLHEAMPVLMPFKIPLLLALSSLSGLSFQLWLNRDRISWHPVLTFLCIFTFWVFLSCIFATSRVAAFSDFNSIFIKIFIMVFAIAWLPEHPDQLRRFPFWLLLCGLVIAAIALHNKANGIGLVEGTRVTIGRDIRSMLGDPNDLALVLQFPMAFAVTYCFFGSKLQRFGALFCVVFLLFGLLATQSRGGLLAVVSTFFFMAVLRTRSLVLPGVIGVISLATLVLAAGISDRASGGAAESGVDESAMGRVYAWVAAFRMAVADPFTGVGLNNFYLNYYFYSPHWDGKNHAVHSTWFEMLGELGFAGLVLFLLMLFCVLTTSRRLLRTTENTPMQPLAESLWLALISFCVGGTFLTQGFTWPLYILIGLIVALDRLTQPSRRVAHDQPYHTS
uniref:O-antigen ligase family protein n=1 Tax=Thaumasiovibrio occultus TaxID=1891184 RepID=UPI000B3519DE|nr:O-antigen ligase family protein [Thaumasiovibrio occultus]